MSLQNDDVTMKRGEMEDQIQGIILQREFFDICILNHVLAVPPMCIKHSICGEKIKQSKNIMSI
jgi:hypothetical protein